MSFKCKYLCILEKCCCCIDLKKGNIALGLVLICLHSSYFLSQMAITNQIINDTTGYWDELVSSLSIHMQWLMAWVGYHTLAICMAIVQVSGAIQPNDKLLRIALWWNCCNIIFMAFSSFIIQSINLALLVVLLIYYTVLNYSLLQVVNYELSTFQKDDDGWSYELHPFYN